VPSLPIPDASRFADLGAGLAEPSLDDARALHRLVVATRRLDQRIAALARQGRVPGAFYSGMGNEATAVGLAAALEPRDVLLPTHRDLGAHLVHGHTVRDVLLQYFKRDESQTRGKDVGLHLGRPGSNIVGMVSHIGHMLPVAVGCAWAEWMKRSGAVALTTLGDGGTSIGDFHESLNLASVRRLPVVFAIENNQYAYSTPLEHQYACARLCDRAQGYGIPGEQVDGTDALAVREAARRAVARARGGEGPTLLECVTLRLRGHSEHDDASYVPRETLERWRGWDPVERFDAWLVRRGVAPAALEAVRAEIDAEIDREVEYAESRPLADPSEGGRGAFTHWEAGWRP
jgi:TPP-dependent pyruvate/acetoin dehydrogenase alpha subunit